MTYEFGDIVLVPFPFTSQATSKQRPAVVISSHGYGLQRLDVILMAITSQIRPTLALGEVWLRHCQDAGLLKPSAVKPIIATLEQALVRKTLGVLAGEDQTNLRRVIDLIIG
jgi:mRNA interferase MazF